EHGYDVALQRPAIGFGQTLDFLGQMVVVQARVIVLAERPRLLRCPLGDIPVIEPVHAADPTIDRAGAARQSLVRGQPRRTLVAMSRLACASASGRRGSKEPSPCPHLPAARES